MSGPDLERALEALRSSNAAHDAHIASQNGNHADDAPATVETLRLFLKRDLPQAESLCGVTRDGTNLIPRYGWVMPWGKEGSGKTSVLVDLLFHAGAGLQWLHYTIPRPLRIVAVINEGVPGGLQDKLRQKTERWEGDTAPILDNIAIYSSPWGEFTFKNTAIADHVRAFAVDFRADYLALDPLHTLGTTGAGTPEETETFKHTLRDYGLWDDLGFITAHHSNKNGMVSGDWGRHVDTLIHIEKDGKRPATKFTLEKARPASPDELQVPQLLEWETASLGYRRVAIDTGSINDTDLLQRIYQLVDEAGQITISDLRRHGGHNKDRVGNLAKAEVAAGRLTNIATGAGRWTLARSPRDTSGTPEDENTLFAAKKVSRPLRDTSPAEHPHKECPDPHQDTRDTSEKPHATPHEHSEKVSRTPRDTSNANLGKGNDPSHPLTPEGGRDGIFSKSDTYDELWAARLGEQPDVDLEAS